jgi:hypothetical protein
MKDAGVATVRAVCQRGRIQRCKHQLVGSCREHPGMDADDQKDEDDERDEKTLQNDFDEGYDQFS